VLQLQTAGTTAVTIDAAQAVTFSAGTASGVAYLNGSKVLTTGSALTFDGTNLGIGTSSPATKLALVVSGTGTAFDGFQAGNGAATFRLGVTGASYSYAGAGANETWLYTAGSGTITIGPDGVGLIKFVNNGSERMRLDSSGNLGIGTTSPSASAILDAQSTTKGVRMPNMTTTQKNAISSPAAGLMVFDTTLAKLCVYSGSAWQTITSV
jgi:hypothetical protein